MEVRYINFTRHVLDQIKARKGLVGKKAEMYLTDKFKELIAHGKSKRGSKGAFIVTRDNIKIVYKKEGLEFKLITYAEHKEVDHIEYGLMKILRCTN